MTTIAWDSKVLATDSKASQGQDIAMINDVVKIYLPGPEDYWEIMGNRILAFGLAGAAQDRFWVMEELNKGVTHKTRIDEAQNLDFIIIAVDEMGVAWYWGMSKSDRRPDGLSVLNPSSGPCAAGSGQVIAQAVMSTGAGAAKGIEQAIRLDNHSGGSIQTWEFPGKPEVKSQRPVVEEKPQIQLSAGEMAALIKETAFEVHARLVKEREERKAQEAAKPAANDTTPEPTDADNAIQKVPA